MGRISKFDNAITDRSRAAISSLRQNATPDIESVERFQMLNGISDAMLAHLIGTQAASISRWKKGTAQLTDAAAIALHFAIRHFKP